MPIPIVPIIEVTDLVLTALELRNEILKNRRIALGKPERSANKMGDQIDFNFNGGGRSRISSFASRFGIGSVSSLPRRDQGKFIRDSNGEILLFTIDPTTFTVKQLPAGSFKHRRSLEKRGVNLFVQDALTGQIVDFKPRRRRMNPLNFSALKRADRRLSAFEKTIKKHFTVGAPKKKRIKRKKRRK